MQYELEVLDDLVFEHLNPKVTLHTKPDSTQLNEYNGIIKAGKDSAGRNIRKAMSNFATDGQRRTYVYLQQSGITRLMDAIIHYLMPKDVFDIRVDGTTLTIGNTYSTAYLALHELMQMLQSDYPKYFDSAGKMPDVYKWQASVEMEANYKSIKKSLEKAKVKPAFRELLAEPFEYFLVFENSFSFRELDYLKEFQKNILEIIDLKLPDMVAKITDQLLYLNFNSILFSNYLIHELTEQSYEKKGVAELADFYSWHIKIFNQKSVKPGWSYCLDLMSIQDRMVTWLSEDLYYLNKKHQLTLPLPAAKEVVKDKTKKVHVNLTVPDLALGARLLLDDVIVNSNYSEIMERIAKSFRTNRRESLSSNNTYNEGFNISVVTKEKMKGLLLKLSRKVNDF